jgi:hypothetical protein
VRIRNWKEFKDKHLGRKLTNNRIGWYGHILRMNEEKVQKNTFNTKVKKKTSKGRMRSRLGKQVRKAVKEKD